MFAKLSTLAVLVPFVSALTLNIPTAPTTGGTVTVTWTATTTDPGTFSLELTNSAFHNTFAISNNVVTATGSITLTLPQVSPGDGYTLEAVAVNDIYTVYSTTGDFSIGAATSTSASSTSGTTASVSTLSASTSSGSVTAPSVTPTTPVSSASSVSSPATSSSSTASSTPSTFTSGAASFKLIGVVPAAALALSAVAGAAMVF